MDLFLLTYSLPICLSNRHFLFSLSPSRCLLLSCSPGYLTALHLPWLTYSFTPNVSHFSCLIPRPLAPTFTLLASTPPPPPSLLLPLLLPLPLAIADLLGPPYLGEIQSSDQPDYSKSSAPTRYSCWSSYSSNTLAVSAVRHSAHSL